MDPHSYSYYGPAFLIWQEAEALGIDPADLSLKVADGSASTSLGAERK